MGSVVYFYFRERDHEHKFAAELWDSGLFLWHRRFEAKELGLVSCLHVSSPDGLMFSRISLRLNNVS